LVQKYLLPQLILKLENALAQNTSYEFTIAKPEIKFLSITIPEIKITSGEKIIFVNGIKIHPTIMAFIHRKLKLQGTGNIHIEQERFKFEVKDLTYDTKNNTLILKAIIPAVKLNSYFKTILYLKNSDITAIKNITGLCGILLEIKTGGNKQLELEAVLTGSDIGFSYQNKNIKLPTFTAQYKKTAQSQILKASSENFYILSPDTKEQLVKNGEFTLETDFKTAKIQNVQAIIKNIAWEGDLKIDHLKSSPDMSFNLTSALCKASGKIKKADRIIYFTAHLNRDSNNLYIEGNYNLGSQMLIASGNGNTDIKTLLSYTAIAENSVLNTISADLKIADLKISYNKISNIFSGYIEFDIGQFTIDKHILSDKGKLVISIENNNLQLQNLTLINGYGNIQSKGSLTLKGQIPFQMEMQINNYELRKLTQPFIEKDIGNALFSANCSIQGAIKEQNSILGVCKWAFVQGDIGQLKFLPQIASLINKPELKEISFNRGEGTITFKNNTFNTPGSVLISPHLNLAITGTMNTSGDLNLTLTTEFPQKESAAESDSPFRKFEELLSIGMGGLFHKIQITGTIQNPKYTVIPEVDRILQKIFQ